MFGARKCTFLFTTISISVNMLYISPNFKIIFRYIHRLCIENNTTNVYGILEPTFLNIVGDAGKKSDQRISQSKCKKYIQHKLQNEKKECQLLPFNHG